MVFLFIIALFSRYYFATIDCVADEGVGPEDFEDPEDFAEPGKQPLTMTPLLFIGTLSDCMMMKYDGGKLVVNHHMMHTPTHDFTLFMIAMSRD